MTEHPTIPEPVNVVIRTLLRSPLHWAMSHNTMVLSVTGRRTGRIYRVPISYSHDGRDLVCFTDAPWWRNLRGGAPVVAAIRGRPRQATAVAVTGPVVAEHLAAHLRIVPRDAKYHSVQLTHGTDPDATDLARAAAKTAMIRVRLHDHHSSPAVGDVDRSRGGDAAQWPAYRLAALLLVIGIGHFVIPQAPDALIPPQLPGHPRSYTYLSGVAELVIGAMLLAPSTRRRAGLAAAALFVAVFPANLYMVRLWQDKPWPMRAIAIARLPLQIPLIAEAVKVKRTAGQSTVQAITTRRFT